MNSRKLKIGVLIEEGLLPPDSINGIDKDEKKKWQVEYDVISALKKLGHEVYPVEMFGKLEPLRKLLEENKPNIVFNLLEEFTEFPLFDQQVISYVEMKKISYTGCNPRGLMIAKDKALSKKILAYHNINIPEFYVFPMNKKIKKRNYNFPLIVKSISDEGSAGISKNSLVNSFDKLKERIEFIHNNYSAAAIAEQFIDGREIYCGVIGNSRLTVLSPWELLLKNNNSDIIIATSKMKWNESYQKQIGLVTKAAKLPDDLNKQFEKISKIIYNALCLSGYARIDYKMNGKKEIYLIEANPNPFLAREEDFAASAKHYGISYEKLIQSIINNGMNYKPF
jgi:D-alanine-D-alanine ligase